MNLAQLMARSARVFPDRAALLQGDRVLSSYRELGERCARLAAHLTGALELVPGDRVALWLTNHPAYLELLFGVWWAGGVVVPINAKLHAKEAAYILADSGAAALFTDADLAAAIDREGVSLAGLHRSIVVGSPAYEALFATEPGAPTAPAEREADDLAWLFYTSGTTGRPKGVMLTHRNLLTMTACYFADVDSVDAEDATVYAAPFSHGAGIYSLPFVARAARHVVPVSGGFDPAELVELSRAVGRLCLFAAPTMVRRLVDHIQASAAPVDGFRTIVYGGGPMYVSDIRRALEVMGSRFVQIYGQGESPMTITALGREHLAAADHARWQERIASVGVAQMLVEVRVVDDEGRVLPAGEIGEVLVRGDTVMAGYWGDPEATRQALRDGWLWTGDMGSFDSDGFLTLKDRSKDLIISGGSNIYPREVEEVLLRHPRVREVAVVGRPDPEWGEIVVAFAVGDHLAAEELDALCLAEIARFKRPKLYRFVDQLPKNNYGKVLKTALRDLLGREASP